MQMHCSEYIQCDKVKRDGDDHPQHPIVLPGLRYLGFGGNCSGRC